MADETQSKNEALLQEIRDRYRYASDVWRPIKDERAIDLRYICGDPWEEADRKARADAGRPCINHDELGQYVNQCVNSARQNKRGIKVEPGGNGSSDKTAEFRQNLIRGIEYKSKAAATYLAAFQQMVEGSYAFFRISRRYVSDKTFDQEIVVKPVANPNAVLYDPDCKEPDWSDGQYCFVLEPLQRDDFKKRWPDAQVKDFTADDMRIARDWIGDKQVLTAEYWRIETTSSKLYLLDSGEVVEELPEGAKAQRTRAVEKKKLVQYWTNGVEILERNEEPGEQLSIIPMIGLERWLEVGEVARRKLFSLVRLARDPQMSLAHLVSQQQEEAGLTPKVPYIGYKGQFETDAEAWETVTKVPHAFLQADPMPDGAGGYLPLPTRQMFTPNFAAYEVAKDSARRAIQAAMGITPLPTAAQRNNEKSGIALKQIQQAQEVGSYHFLDSYDRALQSAGRLIDSWIPVVYDTEREVAVRKPDDSHQVARINTEAPYQDEKGEEHHYPIEDVDHDVTVSTGPSSASQQEAASDFLDLLISNLGAMPIAPPQQAKLLSMAIRMKQLGPKGDQMAEIISPEDNQQQIPPQAQQAMAQANQHLQALNAYAQKLEAQVKELEQEKQAKVVDNEYRLKIEQLKIEAQVTLAEINTKSQVLNERMQFVQDVWQKLQDQEHEATLQASDQAHKAGMAAAGQAHEQGLQASDQANQQQLADQAQAAQQQQPAQEQAPVEGEPQQ